MDTQAADAWKAVLLTGTIGRKLRDVSSDVAEQELPTDLGRALERLAQISAKRSQN
jgi:hypothetical protein